MTDETKKKKRGCKGVASFLHGKESRSVRKKKENSTRQGLASLGGDPQGATNKRRRVKGGEARGGGAHCYEAGRRACGEEGRVLAG